jgi:homoserine O-acetyltransferase/O-succinyltransferase
MARALRSSLALLMPSLIACSSAETARLGDLRLESGQVLADCRVTYRTLGRLNAERSNAVLVLPWFQGTSVNLALQVGPGKLVDTSKYFVVLVDALGNGAASSPSNSTTQPGAAFPAISMRDIVESQFQLITRTLGLQRLHAVVGISMGGMQAFEWAVRHPGFAARTVSIVGSPQTQPDDVARWEETLRWIAQPSWSRTRSRLSGLQPRAALGELRLQVENQRRQIAAIVGHDITREFGGSLERTTAALRTELLVIGTRADREVNPRPAFELAKIAGARILELDGRCGHQAPSCERATLWPAMERFLAR